MQTGWTLGYIDGLPQRTINELEEYERLEPFGAWRDNWHSATIATMIANALTGKRGRGYSPSDFMYRDSKGEQLRQERQFLSRLKTMAVKRNG